MSSRAQLWWSAHALSDYMKARGSFRTLTDDGTIHGHFFMPESRRYTPYVDTCQTCHDAPWGFCVVEYELALRAGWVESETSTEAVQEALLAWIAGIEYSPRGEATRIEKVDMFLEWFNEVAAQVDLGDANPEEDGTG
ncbi:hypothetical protein ACM66B_003381 [Microbotryomycetes sp. NB124-2]